MPDIVLPAQGETPWGEKLSTAINAINTAVEDLEAAGTGGVDAAEVRAIVAAQLLGGTNLEVVQTGNPVGTTLTVRTTTAFGTAFARKVDSDDIDTVRIMTQAGYDALATKDPRTLYVIRG